MFVADVFTKLPKGNVRVSVSDSPLGPVVTEVKGLRGGSEWVANEIQQALLHVPSPLSIAGIRVIARPAQADNTENVGTPQYREALMLGALKRAGPCGPARLATTLYQPKVGSVQRHGWKVKGNGQYGLPLKGPLLHRRHPRTCRKNLLALSLRT